MLAGHQHNAFSVGEGAGSTSTHNSRIQVIGYSFRFVERHWQQGEVFSAATPRTRGGGQFWLVRDTLRQLVVVVAGGVVLCSTSRMKLLFMSCYLS